MTDKNLAPCPICGSEEQHIECCGAWYWIECGGCGHEGPESKSEDERLLWDEAARRSGVREAAEKENDND